MIAKTSTALTLAGFVTFTSVGTSQVQRELPANQVAARRNVRGSAASRALRTRFLNRHPAASIIEDRVLAPEPGNDEIAPEVRLLRLSDGAVNATVSETLRLTSTPIDSATYFYFDLNRRTYRTFKLSTPPTQAELDRIEQFLRSRQAAQLGDFANDLMRVRNTSDRTPAATSRRMTARPWTLFNRLNAAIMQDCPCWGYFWVDIITKDPPGYTMNETNTQLDWSDDDYCEFWYDGDQNSAYAYAPTGAGTNWYVWYDNIYTDPEPAWGTGYTEQHAGYYNYDFPPSAGQRVNSYSDGYLSFDSGWIDGQFSWGADGAYTASYLKGWRQQSGADYCYYGF